MQGQKPQRALITGASAGIGYELSKLLAQDGYSLVLLARDANRLESVATELKNAHHIEVQTIVKDLSLHQAAEQVHEQLKDLEIDVLINNAGFGSYGAFATTDKDKETSMMQTNMVALTTLTKLFLPDMLERGYGRILNVASLAAFQPGPFMAVYYATKAFVLHFSEALAEELAGTGVTVTALCPGAVATNFQKEASMERSSLVADKTILDAASVAKTGYTAMLSGRRIVIPGLQGKLFVFAERFATRKFITRMVSRIQKPV
jgi:short-subunit dehydrogenase